MSAPLDFLRIFAELLRSEHIPFAITSGMACVHYGLQQTTKDSDWIIPADGLPALVALLKRKEGELPPWRITYRQIFGAPLDAEYMRHGWTSHLSIWDQASSVEHKVDIFSKPPRVRAEELEVDAAGWATEHVVAQMKKTDRDRDWPIVHGLGRLLWEEGNALGLLHLNQPDSLWAAWEQAPVEMKTAAARRRPLLNHLLDAPPLTNAQLKDLLLMERRVWERVNEERHGRYTRAWKDFYRAWRRSGTMEWPTTDSFLRQHRMLNEAVRRYDLPSNPLAELSREGLVQTAVEQMLSTGRYSSAEVASVLPPAVELLP